MYERFTDRARKVMQLANREATRSKRKCVDAEHVLLGLLAEGSGVAANVLRNLGFELDDLGGSVEWRLEFGLAPPSKGKLPLAPRAKRLIEQSMEEARKLGHNYVGTEHLLLGLTRQTEGVVVEVLAEAGLTSEIIREEILHLLGVAEPSQPGMPVAPSVIERLAAIVKRWLRGQSP